MNDDVLAILMDFKDHGLVEMTVPDDGAGVVHWKLTRAGRVMLAELELARKRGGSALSRASSRLLRDLA